MHKILVVGGSGLVGRAVIDELIGDDCFQVYGTYCRNPISLGRGVGVQYCVDSSDDITDILQRLQPDSVLTCLRGDFNRQLLLHMSVARYLADNGGRLYFCSTANVFDNDLSKPHYEGDIPNSCSDYGRYKIDCEQELSKILGESACILRLPQVWGSSSKRMNQLLNSSTANERVTLYPRLFITTITDTILAKMIAYIIRHDLKGCFHLSSDDYISHKDFYNRLITGLKLDNVKTEDCFEEEGCFSLHSNRSSEFPADYSFKSKDVISELVKSPVPPQTNRRTSSTA